MTTYTRTGGSVGSGKKYITYSNVPGYLGVSTVPHGDDTWSRVGEKRPLPKGWKYPTAYTASFRWGDWNTCSGGRVSLRDSNGVTIVDSGCLSFNTQWSNLPSSVSVFAEAAATRAILNARSRIKAQKVNLGVAFLERKQTAALFGSAAKTVGNAIDCALNHDWRGLKKTLGLPRKLRKQEKKALRAFGRSPKLAPDRRKLASNLWLANAYGLQPTLSDLKGSVETLAENDVRDAMRYRCKAVGMATEVERPDYTRSGASGSGSEAILVPTVLKKSCCLVRVDSYLVNPALAQAANLGLTNPATWLWEKTPWSFVVDWLLPIGAYLDSMDATLGWTFRSGSITRRLEWKCSQYAKPGNPGPNTKFTVSASGRFGSKKVTRSTLSAYPFPSKIMDLVRNPLSTGHLLNALALKGSRYH